MSRRLGSWLPGGGGDAVVGILERLRAPDVRSVLDVPSGGVPVRRQLEALGYDVFESDLSPRKKMRGVVADACAPFPFRTGAFDVVLSMEGIEHFENQAGFVRECARVLRPGGFLVLTTPSVLHLNARLAMLLTAQRSLHQGIVNEAQTLRARNGSRLYHGHAFLIDAFRLRYLLRIAGFDLDQVHAAGLSLGSVALAFLAPAIWCATRFSLLRGRRRSKQYGRGGPEASVETELRRIATSPAILFGKKLVVVARKGALAAAT